VAKGKEQGALRIAFKLFTPLALRFTVWNGSLEFIWDLEFDVPNLFD
jgi:hypothetical protein